MPNLTVPAAATGLPEDDAIMQFAELHGLRTPRFSREGAPEAWQCWTDRVLNLNTCRPERLAEMIRDADRAAGYAALPLPIVTVEQHFLRNLARRDRALAIAETAEVELTAIIEAMDDAADDTELEDDGDDEPSLGAPDQVNQHLSHGRRLGNRENLEYEGDTLPECDREPSLGSTGSTSEYADQALWALTSMLTDDGEDEHDGTEPEIDEPSLGAQAWAPLKRSIRTRLGPRQASMVPTSKRKARPTTYAFLAARLTARRWTGRSSARYSGLSIGFCGPVATFPVPAASIRGSAREPLVSFSAVVHAMANEGCTPEQIASAVQALELANERAKEVRRARLRESAAERQRRLREKRRHAVSRCDSALPPSPSSPDKEGSPIPSKEIKPPTTSASGESTPARDRQAEKAAGQAMTAPPSIEDDAARHTSSPPIGAASRLPADFEASAVNRAFGRAEGLTDAEIDRTVRDLRLCAAEAVGRSDWHATLRRFMRRDADAKRAKQPKPQPVSEIR